MLYGAIEAGGTKMVMAVSDENMKIIKRESVPTLTPEETCPQMLAFFKDTGISKLGIGSFGPLDLNPASPTYGNITSTPKLAWKDFPLLDTFQSALKIPCAIDTDVNAAALCEARMGAAKGLKNCVYVTIGTGIGAGVYCEGKLVHGAMHPEWGHLLMRPYPGDRMEKGPCPYHTGCLEDMASGPAIQKRFGVSAKELPAGHEAWDIEAYYLAQLCVTALMTLATEKIILGGGVMAQSQLFSKVRKETAHLLNGYLTSSNVQNMDELIVPPQCYPDSGLIGSLLLAEGAM